MENVLEDPVLKTPRTTLRSFRPLIWWVTFSLCLLVWDFHRRLASDTTLIFDVFIDGKPVHKDSYFAQLGNRPIKSGQVAPIGARVLRIAAPDAELFEERVEVSYGSNDLTRLDLYRSHGVLELKSEPIPKLLQAVGRYHSFVLTNSPGITSRIPVGEYVFTAEYERASEARTMRVVRNQTNQFDFKVAFGALQLMSEPSISKFTLVGAKGKKLQLEGETPALLEGLPIGPYHLRLQRDDYLKEQVVYLRDGETNIHKVVFEYGEVFLASDPPGATITARNGMRWGETPWTSQTIKPGAYTVRVEKSGYEPTNVVVEVVSGKPFTNSVSLISRQYVTAMAQARRDLNSERRRLERAQEQVVVALQLRPGDPEALKLQTEIEFAVAFDNARQFAAKHEAGSALQALESALKLKPDEPQAMALKTTVEASKTEWDAEQRKNLGTAAFRKATDSIKDAALFDTHTWTLNTSLDKVRDSLLRAFNKGPPKWDNEGITKLSEEMLLIRGSHKEIFKAPRRCVVLIHQVSPNEVQLYAKFWDYVLSTKAPLINLGGELPPDALIPVHKDHYRGNQAGAADQRRKDMAETFYKNLQNELRSIP